MEQQILKALEILVSIAITGGVAFVSPYAIKVLKAIEAKAISELGLAQETEIKNYIMIAVKYVAQKEITLTNEQKLAKALSMVEAKFGVNIISESDILVLIESAVKDLNIAQGQTTNVVAK
ncbi:hypothetical protein [Clostridium sp.]|uniref:hypothetical protein n=1 Tax=Clostridium sp. TaxID=1506 RepID=UPI002635ABBB|nr:hypothetical protein [Clostridium sp.]